VSYEVTPAGGSGANCFGGTASVDGNNEPICGDSCQEESCCDYLAAEIPISDCEMCAVGNCSECSDPGCEDGSISLCEMISYACAWKNGCNDDIGGMTRAAFVWHNGECYCWDEVDQNWISSDCGSAICCDVAATAASAASASGRPGGSAVLVLKDAWRGLSYVTIHVSPDEGVSASAVELVLPDRWTVVAVGQDGQYDSRSGKIKWGLFLGDQDFHLTAKLQNADREAVDSALRASKTGRTRAGQIRGVVAFDGAQQAIIVKN
jgi:hypothetical protein